MKPQPKSRSFPRLDWWIAFALLALCGSLFFRELGSRELWASHEARAAQNAQRILDDGTWFVPRLYDDQPELQKPAGYYWLVAAIGWLRGGVDPVAVRLPAALAGTLTVFLVWGYLRRRGRAVAAVVAAVGLATAVHFTGTARIGRIDVPLTLAITILMLGGRTLCSDSSFGACSSGPDANPGRFVTGILLALVGASALLLKGPIGFVLPAAALGVYWLTVRVPMWKVAAYGSAVGVVTLAVAAPWYLWADHATGGEFLRTFIHYHHFNRAFGGAEALAGHPWWYYLPRFAADFLPWTLVLLVALAQRRWRGDADAWFGLIWLVTMMTVLSLSRFKRADYLLPAYPGAAIYVGCAMESWFRAWAPRIRTRAAIVFVGLVVVVPIGWMVFDRLVTDVEEARREQVPFASVVRTATGGDVVLFRVESHLLAFHLGRPVHTLVEWGDLERRVSAPGPHFVVTRAEFLDEVREHVRSPLAVVARSADVTRAPPHRPLLLLRIDTGPNPWPTPPD